MKLKSVTGRYRVNKSNESEDSVAIRTEGIHKNISAEMSCNVTLGKKIPGEQYYQRHINSLKVAPLAVQYALGISTTAMVNTHFSWVL